MYGILFYEPLLINQLGTIIYKTTLLASSDSINNNQGKHKCIATIASTHHLGIDQDVNNLNQTTFIIWHSLIFLSAFYSDVVESVT